MGSDLREDLARIRDADERRRAARDSTAEYHVAAREIERTAVHIFSTVSAEEEAAEEQARSEGYPTGRRDDEATGSGI